MQLLTLREHCDGKPRQPESLGESKPGPELLHSDLAPLPVSGFIVGAHKLLLRQVTTRVTAQSSQTARLIAGLMENHLNQSCTVVRSV